MNADPLQNILMQTAKNAILRPFPGKWFEPVCVLKYYSDSSFRKPFLVTVNSVSLVLILSSISFGQPD